MSKVQEKSPRHCGKQGLNNTDAKRYKKIFYALSVFLVSVLCFIFLVWFIVRPSKPQFTLKEADIYQLNLSLVPYVLNSSIELTLLSDNPNRKVGIYYDELQVYASYKRQQITLYTPLPPLYQDCQESNLLSASLVGNGLPVAPSFGYEVGRDLTAGRLILKLKLSGRLRWKVGTWVSSRFRFNVDCIAIIMPFGPSTIPLTSKEGGRCSTSL